MIDPNKQYRTREGCEVRIYVAFRSEDGALDYADSNWPSFIECHKVDCELVGEL